MPSSTMDTAEFILSVVVGGVVVVLALILLRRTGNSSGEGQSRWEQETRAFGSGPLGLTRRAVILWLIGAAIALLLLAVDYFRQ